MPVGTQMSNDDSDLSAFIVFFQLIYMKELPR